MAAHRKPELPDWRDYLRDDERADVEALEANSQRLASEREDVSREIRRYRQMCLQRRKQSLANRAMASGDLLEGAE